MLSDEFSENIYEPLDEQWWEREQEELQLRFESDKHRIPPESESYETVTDEQIDYANDEKQIKLAIEHLENLRLELQDLRQRKTRVFNILTEHIEKGLVSLIRLFSGKKAIKGQKLYILLRRYSTSIICLIKTTSAVSIFLINFNTN